MSFRILPSLRWAPLLALCYLLGAHALSGARRTPELLCQSAGRRLVIFPEQPSPAPAEWIDPALLAENCEPVRSALFLLDGVPAPLREPLLRAVARAHDRISGGRALRFAYRAQSGHLGNVVRVLDEPGESAAETWPKAGTWAAMQVSPPGDQGFPLATDPFSTLGAAILESGVLRVEWLDSTGAPRAERCDLPALARCEPAEAVAPPSLLTEWERAMRERCEAARGAHARPPVACGVREVNARLAACPASLSAEEERDFGAAFASVPFFLWPRSQVKRMQACPALAANEVVRSYLEMRLSKTIDW